MEYKIFNIGRTDWLSPIIPTITSILGFILVYLDYHFLRVIIAVGFGLMSFIGFKRLVYYRKNPYIIIKNNVLIIQQSKKDLLQVEISNIKALKCTRYRYIFNYEGIKVVIYKAFIKKNDNTSLAKAILSS